MVKGIYVQHGESIDYRNDGSNDIGHDEVVTLTGRIGIAGTDIPVGRIGSLHVIGVFDLPAGNTEAFTVGQAVYWDGAKIVSAQTDNTPAGWAVEAKPASGAIARVKIG